MDKDKDKDNIQGTGAEAAEDKFDAVKVIEGQLAQNKPLTKDEIEAQRKRRNAQTLIANIGDAAAAVGNIIFTAKGAPNMVDPRSSLTAKTRERWDKIKADREGKDKLYWQLATQRDAILGQRADRAARAAAATQQQANWDKDYALRAAADERAGNEHELKLQLMNKQITQAEYEAEMKKLQAENMPKQLELSNRAAEMGIANQAQALQKGERENYYDIPMGVGGYSVRIPKANIGPTTASYLYDMLDAETKSRYRGAPIYTRGYGGVQTISGYGQPSEDVMWQAIGEYLSRGTGDNVPRLRQEIEALANPKRRGAGGNGNSNGGGRSRAY